MNPYISEQNAGEFTFYRVPKALIDDARYRGISNDAKLLYALLLDRLSLSLRSGWQDEQGSAYLYYSVAAVREALDCCKEKACKLLRELEDAHLIERRAQGRGKPDSIYLRCFGAAENRCERSVKQDTCGGKRSDKQDTRDGGRSEKQDTSDGKQSEKRTWSGRKSRPPEVGKTDHNKTEKNKTDLSKIYRSSPEPMMEDEIREQIEYETLVRHYPADTLDCMVSLIADVERSTAPTLRVGKEDVPRTKVLERLRALDRFHIEYILDCMEESRPNICNIRGYLLTALYRAPETMEGYYAAKVACDEGAAGYHARAA